MQNKLLILLVVVLCFSGCSQPQAQDSTSQQVIAKVNEYTITTDDFSQEVGLSQSVLRSVSSIPIAELKLGILDEMINRQLLLEEAQKINLDKDEEFMHEIENFWRLALIKRLIKHKMADIERSTTVTDEEIQTEYMRQRDQLELLEPMEQMAPKIKKAIVQFKVQKALQEWEDSLKSKAVIKRDEGVLNVLSMSASQGGVNGQHK